jgi:hypothetical protein
MKFIKFLEITAQEKKQIKDLLMRGIGDQYKRKSLIEKLKKTRSDREKIGNFSLHSDPKKY